MVLSFRVFYRSDSYHGSVARSLDLVSLNLIDDCFLKATGIQLVVTHLELHEQPGWFDSPDGSAHL